MLAPCSASSWLMLRQHAGNVAVQMHQAGACPASCGSATRGRLTRQRGRAAVRGSRAASRPRTRRCPAEPPRSTRPRAGSGSTLGRPRSSERELLAPAARLLREHVHRRAGQVPGLDVRRSAAWSTTKPRDRFRNRLPGFIAANSASPNRPLFPGRPSTCSVTTSEISSSSSMRAAAPRVAQGQLVRGVVEVHGHAEALGQHRQLAADVAVADDAEPPPADLVAARGGLVPQPRVHLRGSCR